MTDAVATGSSRSTSWKLAADARGKRRARIRQAVEDAHPGTLGREAGGNLATDAAGPASDDDAFS